MYKGNPRLKEYMKRIGDNNERCGDIYNTEEFMR